MYKPLHLSLTEYNRVCAQEITHRIANKSCLLPFCSLGSAVRVCRLAPMRSLPAGGPACWRTRGGERLAARPRLTENGNGSHNLMKPLWTETISQRISYCHGKANWKLLIYLAQFASIINVLRQNRKAKVTFLCPYSRSQRYDEDKSIGFSSFDYCMSHVSPSFAARPAPLLSSPCRLSLPRRWAPGCSGSSASKAGGSCPGRRRPKRWSRCSCTRQSQRWSLQEKGLFIKWNWRKKQLLFKHGLEVFAKL